MASPHRLFDKDRRDFVSLGIAMAALILFVGTAGSILPHIVIAWLGNGAAPNSLAANALLLNIALILFGWSRYRDLARDIALHRQREAEARLLAETDPLTNCLNRRSLTPNAKRLMGEAAESNQILAALVLDVDNFKQVNDHAGHSLGDQVLQAITRTIEANLPQGSIIARLGGDEFACMLKFDPRTPDMVDKAANVLIEEIGKISVLDGAPLEISVSVGIARSDGKHASPGETLAGGPMKYGQTRDNPFDCELLLHRADIAMYHAKKHGRACYFWFEPAMESELQFRNDLEKSIRSGIARGEFVPYYEQQIDLATGELVGFEMLARWKSPKLGLICPDVFIPVAEEIGLISRLSENLIRQALEDAKQWDPKLTLSVNISPIQLRDPWFSQKLLRLLVESGFPPHRLEIEITESCIHENLSVVRSVVTSLKNQGIKLSLDDFGTGYSSLSQLRSLPFDRLKIDRSFVTELAKSGGNSKLVEAIVTLGRGLELPVTAEGVENDDVLKVLNQFGDLKGQGYLYGRPEDAITTLQRLAEQHLLANIPLETDLQYGEAMDDPGHDENDKPANQRKIRR